MLYKEFDNVRMYNRSGKKLDPFCVNHVDIAAWVDDNNIAVTNAVVNSTNGEFVAVYSNTLECYTDYYAEINDENDTPYFQSQEVVVELHLDSSDESVIVDRHNADSQNPPYFDLSVDFRSDDNSVSISQKTDSVTDKKYFDLSVPEPVIPTISSSNNSVLIENNNNNYDIKADLRSDDTSLTVIQKTDSVTNKEYFNLQKSPVEAQSLITNGIKATGFYSNYPLTAGVKKWATSVNAYIPLFEIDSTNIGKSSLIFEVIGREDNFGYYAKYYFSSRRSSIGSGLPAGSSGTQYVENGETKTHPIQYYFMGNCAMVAPERSTIFDVSDIVVVECGHTSGHSIYRIYRKVRSGLMDFFAVNVLCHDTPTYCNIKFYYCGAKVNSYNDVSLFPAVGSSDKEIYVDQTNKKVYVWNGQRYVLSENSTHYRVFNPAYINLEPSTDSSISETTFIDPTDNTAKNIVDYAVSATFTNS